MEADTVVILITIVGSLLVSTLSTIGLLLNQMSRLEDRLTGRIDRLADSTGAVGCDVSDVRERVARMEGHLMAPEGFTLRRTQPAAADEPPPEDPAPDRRQAS